MTLTSRSPQETDAAGETLGRILPPGAVVALTGALGAGKTCFIQGLVRGLGVKVRATSPTFTLVNEYRGAMPVYHVDAYRIRSVAELVELGLEEYLDGSGVTVIEWADRAEPLLPARTIRVHIDGLGDEPRSITIERPTA
jgi:tRNA threonylcarbamoyladenosine biosynthesis protein TsaE